MNPKDAHSLIPETCEYIIMAKETADKLTDLKRLSWIMPHVFLNLIIGALKAKLFL